MFDPSVGTKVLFVLNNSGDTAIGVVSRVWPNGRLITINYGPTNSAYVRTIKECSAA